MEFMSIPSVSGCRSSSIWAELPGEPLNERLLNGPQHHLPHFAIKTALEIKMQTRTHFNSSTNGVHATAKTFVAEDREREPDDLERSCLSTPSRCSIRKE